MSRCWVYAIIARQVNFSRILCKGNHKNQVVQFEIYLHTCFSKSSNRNNAPLAHSILILFEKTHSAKYKIQLNSKSCDYPYKYFSISEWLKSSVYIILELTYLPFLCSPNLQDLLFLYYVTVELQKNNWMIVVMQRQWCSSFAFCFFWLACKSPLYTTVLPSHGHQICNICDLSNNLLNNRKIIGWLMSCNERVAAAQENVTFHNTQNTE